MAEPKLAELANHIQMHLTRFESDPDLCKSKDGKRTLFWNTSCFVNGRFLAVKYVSYQGTSNISKADSIKYLAKLEAGYVGRHFEALREIASVTVGQ